MRKEIVLCTCAPGLNAWIVQSIADDLLLSVLEKNGRTVQIVDVRIDGMKIYGKTQVLHEPAPSRQDRTKITFCVSLYHSMANDEPLATFLVKAKEPVSAMALALARLPLATEMACVVVESYTHEIQEQYFNVRMEGEKLAYRELKAIER